MPIPKVELSQANILAAEKILKASKKKTTIGEQMHMINYYAFIHNHSANSNKNFAKLLLGK